MSKNMIDTVTFISGSQSVVVVLLAAQQGHYFLCRWKWFPPTRFVAFFDWLRAGGKPALFDMTLGQLFCQAVTVPPVQMVQNKCTTIQIVAIAVVTIATIAITTTVIATILILAIVATSIVAIATISIVVIATTISIVAIAVVTIATIAIKTTVIATIVTIATILILSVVATSIAILACYNIDCCNSYNYIDSSYYIN